MSLIKFYRADYSTAGVTDAVFRELEAATGRTLAERIDVSLRDGTRQPEFLAVNPNGFVPAIVHDGVPLWESAAITMYLGELHGVDAGLYPPAKTMQRGQAVKWIVWSNVNLPMNARQVSRVIHGKPEEDAAVWELRKKDAETAKEALEKQLLVLDGGLEGKEFLVGEYSLADTHIWSFMSYIKMLGLDLDKMKNLTSWIDRVGAREQLKGLPHDHGHPCTWAPCSPTDKRSLLHASPTASLRTTASLAPNMAAVQHSRTRSDRVGATPAAASASPPPGPSIPTLLTNLRLLDLDLLEDWPGITTATFAGTTQNHKRRVQAVEWALYRLFEIWDPEETASKLKPYFPATDQMQSVNLRAALLRGLENAKKNGALGRDALIRKTMLDDCKGERLEEVLASFSSAVLRSTLSNTSRTRALAVEVALENRGHQGDGPLLRPLIVAHRVSLRRSLERRREAEAKFSDFGDLLAMKERGIARRNEVLRAKQATTSSGGISEDVRRRVRQTVRNNWSGNEAWMDTLLAGDAAGKEAKGLLGTPYDRVWRRVQQGRLAELEDDGRGLLQQLDARVDAQKQRLARWDELRRDMAHGGSSKRPTSPMKRKTAPKPASTGIDLQFNAHKDLHVRAVRGMMMPAADGELHEDYATIIDELHHELTDIKTNSFENALQRLQNIRAQYGQADVSVNLSSDPISELSDIGDMDEDAEHEPEPSHYTTQHSMSSHHGMSGRGLPSRPASIYTDQAMHTLHRSGSDRSYGTPHSEDGYSSASTSRQPSSHLGNLRQQYADGEYSPTTGVSEQTIETLSRSSNSPSPTKRASKPRHTLSLAERTRMSMARRSMQFLEDEEPELPLGPAASNRGGPKAAAAATQSQLMEDDEDEIPDLASRTRMSMVGFEKAQQKARNDRQREMRKELKRARALPPRRENSQWED
ncbi:hypothetical protein PWT90_09451 [Aphanocladium album]|nr:hypothetical protein PWT90_09451 [Aphanocladium album]